MIFWCRCKVCNANFRLSCMNFREAESQLERLELCPAGKHDVSHSKRDWCQIFGTQLEPIGAP